MVILASASPRRKEILEGLGVEIKIITADVDESAEGVTAEQIAETLARKKCEAVMQKLDGNENAEEKELPIISADTVVYAFGEIMGKPKNEKDAFRMLKKLAGKSHTVCTGICVGYKGETHCSSSSTRVFIDPLSDDEIQEYIDSGDPFDKAGAYGIQGVFSKHVSKINGCYFNVVGLPVNELSHLFYSVVGEKLR